MNNGLSDRSSGHGQTRHACARRSARPALRVPSQPSHIYSSDILASITPDPNAFVPVVVAVMEEASMADNGLLPGTPGNSGATIELLRLVLSFGAGSEINRITAGVKVDRDRSLT